jgi:folate-binding protein YgfZ
MTDETTTAITVYDLSDRTQIELTGADRAKFLHGFCTNDIKGLQPGQGCEAFLTNIKGRVLGHIFVFASPESLRLDTTAGQETKIIPHLDRYLIREDVQLIGRSEERGELFVTGNHAAQLLMVENELPLYATVSRETYDDPFDIRRVDLLNEPGFLMSMPRSAIQSTRSSLLAIGCLAGSADEFETRRIEAGFPYYGRDITEDNIAQEVARTKQAISFTKGCYLGQEPIARLDAMGHTNKELRRVVFERGANQTAGTLILAADSDDEAGVITSVAPNANSKGEISAIGYLKTRFGVAGTMVRVSEARGLVQ